MENGIYFAQGVFYSFNQINGGVIITDIAVELEDTGRGFFGGGKLVGA